MELEDETNLMAPQPGQLSIVHPCDVISVYEGSSRSGLVQGADYVEQRSLPGARGSHDHYELPFVDGQANASEGMDRRLSQLVGFL